MSFQLEKWLNFQAYEMAVTGERERNKTNVIDVWIQAELGMELEAGESN